MQKRFGRYGPKQNVRGRGEEAWRLTSESRGRLTTHHLFSILRSHQNDFKRIKRTTERKVKEPTTYERCQLISRSQKMNGEVDTGFSLS